MLVVKGGRKKGTKIHKLYNLFNCGAKQHMIVTVTCT